MAGSAPDGPSDPVGSTPTGTSVGDARVLITADALQRRVGELGRELDAAYPQGVLFVAVLKGSLLFLSDLVRAMTVATAVDFLAISSFEPDSGRVRLVKDLETDISDRDVVLIEDIVDTGLTLGFLVGELRRRSPRSLQVCALLDKTARRILPVDVAYVGFEIPDEFVLGYGLDFAGRYRNLGQLVVGDLAALSNDPDRYVDQLYGRL